MIIIGITGTLGAGKGTIVDYLMMKKGFKHFSVRGFLTEEIQKRNLLLNRDSMVEVANELRAKHSSSYIIEQLYEKAQAANSNCIIESIRTTGEVEALRSKPNFFLFAVDAAPALRYGRVVQRGSETDKVSYETFLANEQREMNSTDPNKQNLAGCLALADYRFTNDGSFDDLFDAVESTIQKIL